MEGLDERSRKSSQDDGLFLGDMITDICSCEFVNEEDICSSTRDISKIPEQGYGGGDANNVLVLPQPSTFQRPPIGPPTPDCRRENGELIHDFSSPVGSANSPFCLSRCSPEQCRCSYPTSGDLGDSPTPKESVFDSFAPGADMCMLAPVCKKLAEERRNRIVRRLSFAGSLNFDWDLSRESTLEISSDEEHLFESVFSMILEAIVSEQTEEPVVRVPAQVPDPPVFVTPKSAAYLSGIAEICPGAPIKSLRKPRNIDKDLCRKLEF